MFETGEVRANECYTQYTFSQHEKENHPKLSQICSYGICSKGLKNEFETAVVYEQNNGKGKKKRKHVMTNYVSFRYG